MNKVTRKQEVRDKVKEIKQRQQNWMKQRAELNTSGSYEPVTSDTGHQQQRTKPVDNIQSQSRKTQNYQSSPTRPHQSSAEKLVASNKSKARFQNWLKTKQEPKDDDYGASSHPALDPNTRSTTYNSRNYEDNYYPDKPYRHHQGTQDVNVLRVPSNRPSDFATPDPDWGSDDDTGEITAAKLLSPDDFDSRADDIIAKVKGDMKITTNHQSRDDNVYGHKRQLPEVEQPTTEQGLSSHVCPTCEQLMLPPENRPMLLIPCGHTLCSSCSRRTKYCALCGCEVSSSTPNIMLQQIITDFHTKQARKQQVAQSVTRSSMQQSYREEYRNLVTRQEIMTEELGNITDKVEKINTKLGHNQQQVHNISKKEKHLEREITNLQEQLAELVSHRQEYDRTCQQLQGQAREERNKMSLVQDSLKTLKQEMEKVKMLATG